MKNDALIDVSEPSTPAKIRTAYSDDPTWVALAKRFYIRLPSKARPPTPEKMRYWLRRFRVGEADYLAMTGYKRIENFLELNPDWSLRAWLGLLLEYVADRDDAKGVLRAYDRD